MEIRLKISGERKGAQTLSAQTRGPGIGVVDLKGAEDVKPPASG